VILSPEKASELQAVAEAVEESLLSFEGCKDVAKLEAFLLRGEIICAKATSLTDDSDVLLCDSPFDVLHWMKARFPSSNTVH
jgi:hypothetical protein